MNDGGTPATGWHPDPTGRNEFRYWDGTAWTDHVATAGQQRDDPVAAPPGASAGVATAPTHGATAPGPIPPVRAHKVWPWVVGGIALVMTPVLVILAVSVLGNTINDKFDQAGSKLANTSGTSDTSATIDKDTSHSITQKQFDAVTVGTSRDQVISQLGKQPQKGGRGCLDYSALNNDPPPNFYEFCFTNGALSTKDSY